MKTKAVVAVLGLAAASLALPAAAQMSMSSAYIGGSLGQSNFKGDCGGSCDKKDTSFRLFGGYQFTPNIAAELGYTDLGKLKIDFGAPFGTGEVSATAWDLSGVFTWPIDQFGVFGRLGVARVEAKPGGALSGDSDTKTGLTWGLGGSYNFNRNLGLRLEYQRFRADFGGDNNDIDNLSLGVVWRFQ